MSDNAAVGLLARMLVGLTTTGSNIDPHGPDFGADFDVPNDHTVAAKVSLPSGDIYRVTVEWLPEESP